MIYPFKKIGYKQSSKVGLKSKFGLTPKKIKQDVEVDTCGLTGTIDLSQTGIGGIYWYISTYNSSCNGAIGRGEYKETSFSSIQETIASCPEADWGTLYTYNFGLETFAKCSDSTIIPSGNNEVGDIFVGPQRQVSPSWKGYKRLVILLDVYYTTWVGSSIWDGNNDLYITYMYNNLKSSHNCSSADSGTYFSLPQGYQVGTMQNHEFVDVNLRVENGHWVMDNDNLALLSNKSFSTPLVISINPTDDKGFLSVQWEYYLETYGYANSTLKYVTDLGFPKMTINSCSITPTNDPVITVYNKSWGSWNYITEESGLFFSFNITDDRNYQYNNSEELNLTLGATAPISLYSENLNYQFLCYLPYSFTVYEMKQGETWRFNNFTYQGSFTQDSNTAYYSSDPVSTLYGEATAIIFQKYSYYGVIILFNAISFPLASDAIPSANRVLIETPSVFAGKDLTFIRKFDSAMIKSYGESYYCVVSNLYFP